MIRRIFLAREWALAAILLLLFGVFALFVPGFLDVFSLLERTRYWLAHGLIAVPMTFIIATAGIDLSVGAIVALCSVALGLSFQEAGLPIAAASALAVLCGAAAGAFNGAVSSYLAIPPLVVTLATMTLYRGLAMGLSEARNISGFPAGFLHLSQGDVFYLPYAGGIPFPIPLAVMLAGYAVGAVLLRHTWIGRYTEHLGENPTAARFAAVPVRPLLFGLYAACGAVAGLAAVFYTALYGTAKADMASGLELDAIACVVIGGTRISGGQASVVGTLLGLGIIGILRYGLELGGLRSPLIDIVVGFLLIATAVFNEWMARRGDTRA